MAVLTISLSSWNLHRTFIFSKFAFLHTTRSSIILYSFGLRRSMHPDHSADDKRVNVRRGVLFSSVCSLFVSSSKHRRQVGIRTDETRNDTVNRTFDDGNPLSTNASIERPSWKLGQRAGRVHYTWESSTQKSPKPVAGSSSPVARCVNNLGQMVCVCAAAVYIDMCVLCPRYIWDFFLPCLGRGSLYNTYNMVFFWSAVYVYIPDPP